jgi:bifunctional enzyme CysN/CysC
MNSSPLRVITVGHVDHGKSTLLGRLLYDTDSLSHEQKQALELAVFDEKGMELSFLLDAFREEQTQNITIDTTQLVFRTPQRSYVLIDAPGHQEFLKNMIAGATRADIALLLIDVKEGIQAQTRRHLQFLSLLGIEQIIVLLNKMDLVHREESIFAARAEEIKKLFHHHKLSPQQIIPIVARSGENLVERSIQMPWYQGPTVLEALETMRSAPELENKPLRLMVQDVYRFNEKRLIVGRVESGTLRVGEEIVFWPGQKTSRVRSIEEWGSAQQPQHAVAGKSVAITLEDPLFVERGHIGSTKPEPPLEAREISAQIFWLDPEPLLLNRSITIQLGTERMQGRVIEVVSAKTNLIMQHDMVDVKIHFTQPLIYDCYEEIAPMGRFAIIFQERLAGGGVITSGRRLSPRFRGDVVSRRPVSQSEATFRHRGAVLWLTGLSGSGKSTIARGLEARLQQRAMATVILDGDHLRQGLCSDLNFSMTDRSENIRRTGEVAKLFAEAGLVAICALISPLSADRERVKASCLRDGILFKEIFVDAPLKVCEARDPRGLYQKARCGEMEQFTGISSPYESPTAADAHLLTAHASCEESIDQLDEMVSDWLEKRGEKERLTKIAF